MIGCSWLLPLSIVKVVGESMQPKFRPGTFLLITPLPYCRSKPKIGDIVVAQVNERKIVKRISEIKNGTYFLLGDNPFESTDSREYGFVSREKIVAKVIWAIGS